MKKSACLTKASSVLLPSLIFVLSDLLIYLTRKFSFMMMTAQKKLPICENLTNFDITRTCTAFGKENSLDYFLVVLATITAAIIPTSTNATAYVIGMMNTEDITPRRIPTIKYMVRS